MNWTVKYLKEAYKDLENLDGSQRRLVLKAINKVQQNPLPINESGYGKPLGNHRNSKLSGLLKIKLRSADIRVVYKLQKIESNMLIIVIGIREDEEVHEIAPAKSEAWFIKAKVSILAFLVL